MKKILEDIKVLDLTQALYGPFCNMILADLGAEVLKVEPPWGSSDRISRGARFGGTSAQSLYINVGKKSMPIDLKNPKGLEIFKKLVPQSDVVVQNFLPGVMERLGLGYEVLKSLNPRVIYAALSGFGQTGPYRERASYASMAEAIAGLSRLTGDYIDPNGPPRRIAESYGDLGPALWAALSIVAAILHRYRTGIGQMIDVAQADCMVALTPSIVAYNLTGLLPWQEQEKYRMVQPIRSGILKVKDGWIRVAGGRPRALDALKERLKVEEVNEKVLGELVENMTRDEAVTYLVELGFPVAPIYNIGETTKDPHLIARGMFVEIEHPIAGKVKIPNFPVKFSETPGEHISAAPILGQHTKEIMMNRLGYSEEQIEQLENEGVIVTVKYSRTIENTKKVN